jgi:hypothetical protein
VSVRENEGGNEQVEKSKGVSECMRERERERETECV